ncbi:hypothetical protein PSA01_09400 [Pseudonocardia saturnea]|uniref:Core-binding (CB) domain-containing protein n=1 Tax=Pseudonocardia saturnea TaxID=33909 RepID=A0ABQ0RTG1_9PSEU|nr:hypothetical protein Pdca_02010 [Pseudonocardia autotrophica]GEC23911.1 hypothetical protein PSA01_09400 [Pseudonocardia saturnea]
MTRDKRTRNANGRSSIYLGSDGSWHGYVTVGTKDNGRSDRRHVRGKTQAAVTKKVRALEKNRDACTIAQPGTNWTVEKWLMHWLDTIVAPPAISPNAHDAYSAAVRVHLIPGIGAHKLDKLQPEHLERLYQKMMRNGAAPGTAHQVHRTVRTALNEAVRRRHATTNPALLAKAPRIRSTEVEPYTVDEVSRILRAAAAERERCTLGCGTGTRTAPGRISRAPLAGRRPRRRIHRRTAEPPAPEMGARLRRNLRTEASRPLPAATGAPTRDRRDEIRGRPSGNRPARSAGEVAARARERAARREEPGG